MATHRRQQVVAGIETLLETVDILIQHLSDADEGQSHEAISVLLLQVMQFGGPGAEIMQLLFPVLNRLQQLIEGSNYAEALEQSELFKTQLQEVRHLVSAS